MLVWLQTSHRKGYQMAGNSKRAIIQLESTAGTGYRYTFTKSKKNNPGRVEHKKYDPIIRKHVLFKETK